MNLSKLFETQKVLRDRIGYEGPDRFGKLILALQVEIGECANEWRGFKFWSNNQEPSKIFHTTEGATIENADYFKCMDEENCGEYLNKDDFNVLIDADYEECPKCKNGYVYPFRKKNPLLEEYVDGLHFILEIGIDLGFEHIQPWISKVAVKFEGNEIVAQFGDVFGTASTFHLYKLSELENWYVKLFSQYLGLGEMLGFTWEKIEQAYYDKNQLNHQRQDSGY